MNVSNSDSEGPNLQPRFESSSITDELVDYAEDDNARKRKLSTLSPASTKDQYPLKYSKQVKKELTTKITTVGALESDGYAWRKYGQKDILGSSFPRSYYRCTQRNAQGCLAMKQVQRVDSSHFNIAYTGTHTCFRTTYENSRGWPDSVAQEGFPIQSLESKPDGILKLDYNVASSCQILPEEFTISSPTDFAEWDEWIPTMSMSSVNDKRSKSNDEIHPVDEFLNSFYYQSTPRNYDMLPHKAEGSWTKLRLLEALLNVGSKKIGIYGSCGIGKTRAMKDVFFHCETNQSFDLVLWVSVTRSSTKRKIQNALVEQLALNVPDSKTDDEVSFILLRQLRARNFVLFIDDVGDIIDLMKVGIPIPCQEQNSKIVMSTRSMNVCRVMEVEEMIEVKALSKTEALQLFRDHVGDVMDSSEINLYAQAIVEECSGLPLTIKVVGSALRMEVDVINWKRFLKEILLANNITILKHGYDRLKEQDVKSCFLYFALLTKGKVVGHSYLMDYLVEEGFIAGSISDTLKRGNDIITSLVNAALLECSNDGSEFKMNDMICNLALMILLSDREGLQLLMSRYCRPMWCPMALSLDMNSPTFEVPESSTEKSEFITSDDQLFLLTATEGYSEPPIDKGWKESRIAYLTDNIVSNLPNRPACSKLVTLFLQRNSSLRAIPPCFFDNMSSLQILNLSRTRIKTLPLSLSKLESLQALVLRNCERLFFLPPVIGALKHLLVLDVYGTEICKLPDEISELSSLTSLYVNFYGPTDEAEYAMLPSLFISKGTISCLNKLRELHISVHPGDPRWTLNVSHVITEVSSLKLSRLSIHLPEIKHLEFIIESPTWDHRTLTHFNFVIGHNVKRIVSHVTDAIENEYNLEDRCLRFVNSEDVPDAVRKVLSEATSFYLDHHLRVHSLEQFGFSNFNNLKFCIVRDCPQLKVIINGKIHKGSCFPFLEHLSIHYSWNLRKICVGPVRVGSFSKLRRLLVHSCAKLEYVLSYSMVANLSSLEELVIEDCQSLKYVVDHDHSSIDDETFIDSDLAESGTIKDDTNDLLEDVFHPSGNTELRIKVLKLHYLPKLENMSKSGAYWPFLEHLSLYSCPLLRNLHLNSDAEVTLKEIKVEADWWDVLEWQDPALRVKLQDCVKEINVDDVLGKM